MRLFAYGTLQDAGQVAAVVGGAVCCRVIGGGKVRGVLYDLGEYPGLRPSESPDDFVPGVVLELDDAALARLDAYEGVADGLYVRELQQVRLDDGQHAAAWVYVYNRSTAGRRRIAAWPPQRG